MQKHNDSDVTAVSDDMHILMEEMAAVFYANGIDAGDEVTRYLLPLATNEQDAAQNRESILAMISMLEG